jgi:hypothetical protein
MPSLQVASQPVASISEDWEAVTSGGIGSSHQNQTHGMIAIRHAARIALT